MKNLYLIRHAKSSWKNMTLSDFDRPLNNRGKKNAPFMAKLLKKKGLKPDLIIASPSYRTRKTAHIFADIFKYNKKEILFFECLYNASKNDILETIKYIDDKFENLFLIGHNPSLNQFVQEYVNFNENIPTSGIIKIEFDCKRWKETKKNNAQLIFFEYPKKYN
ncbi:histidine phosphatase family protein [Arcobacter sp. CECT 8985]|uniref:SixA phosphatase family protein n=1 Tax=Arcobacter sp. CECT 8985 TaxID=1935424 RepID=UPI00100A42D7|nr:histidine phosphatase family protein [Arcobacter sp. CECT 8985]RXJ86591.1 phosphohistidine phosphatase [Arcobacter sp. CECT 8985]